jgi:hypothetical protein
MNAGELSARLHVDNVVLSELLTVLQNQFHEARWEAGDTVDYLRGGEVALTLHYDGVQLAGVRAGPSLEERDVAEIERVLEESVLADAGTKVRRHITFASVPVTAAWRYRDLFQILPAPPGAPRPPVFVADHPFILEVVHPWSSDWIIALGRAQTAVTDVNLVLAGLVPFVRAQRWGRARNLWGFPVGEDSFYLGQPVGPKRSSWIQEGYIVDGFTAVADELATNDGAEVQLLTDSAYYTRAGIPGDSVLDLPSSIEMMFDRFYALDSARRDRLLRWAYWLNQSRQLGPLSSSARYMAIIQAVEGLRPDIPGGPRCSECGRATGPGQTRQFIDFMEQYVARQDGETERARRRLYELRSGLTHGGKLLLDDLYGSEFAPEHIREEESARRALRLARLAGVNWLLADGP